MTKDELRQFVIRLTREVCVRTGDFKPADDVEMAWKVAGPVAVGELVTVKAEL